MRVGDRDVRVTALWRYLSRYESTDDAQVDGHIASVSSRIEGTIVHVYVKDTMAVKAGDPLADIDPRDFEVAVENARANLAQARAQAYAARADYTTAAAKVGQSAANYEKAARDVPRFATLWKNGATSRVEYEEIIRIAKVGEATVTADRNVAESAHRSIAAREAAVKSSQAALDQALLNLNYTKIVAPIDGVVGKKTVEVGQRVQPGEELLALVPRDDVWVTANFKETQIRKMRAHQRVTIHVDALGRDYNGYLDGLGAASGERYSLLPPENATGNYVKVVQRIPVRINFEPGENQDHRLMPGMSVEPKVWVK